MSGGARGRLLAAALAAVMTVAACGSDDDGDARAASSSSSRETTTTEERESATTTEATSTTSTTAASTTTTAPPANSEAAVLADYRKGWEGHVAGLTANPPDPDFPLLLAFYRDGALARSRELITTIRDNGWIVRGDAGLNPKVQSMTRTEAVVYDCVDDRAEAIDPATGAVTAPAEGLVPGEFLLRLEDGRWRTYDFIIREDLRGAICG